MSRSLLFSLFFRGTKLHIIYNETVFTLMPRQNLATVEKPAQNAGSRKLRITTVQKKDDRTRIPSHNYE